jgi:hypothetical protein
MTNILSYRSTDVEMKDNVIFSIQYVLHALSAILLLDEHQDLLYVTAL